MNLFRMLSGTSLSRLRDVMDLSARKQRAYAENLANLQTQGYKRRDIRFADEMRRVGNRSDLKATHNRNMRGRTGDSRFVEIREETSGGSDLEKELVSIAENQLRFSLAARLTSLRTAGLRASIRGRS